MENGSGEERGAVHRMGGLTVLAEAGDGAERAEWPFEEVARDVMRLATQERVAVVSLWLECLGGHEYRGEAPIRGETLCFVMDHADGKWSWTQPPARCASVRPEGEREERY